MIVLSPLVFCPPLSKPTFMMAGQVPSVLKTSSLLGVLLLALLLQTLIFTYSSTSIFSFTNILKPTTQTTPSIATTHPTDTMATKLSADLLLQLIKNRRTYYPLTKDLTITPSRIQEIVNESTLHTPSSFNSQSNRLVVLFGAEHDKLWDITTETLKKIVPQDQWEHSAQRMSMFKGAAGTILFFDDQTVVEGMQAKFAAYADKFPLFASQSLAMQQFVLWTALEAEGLGANLQHYSPLIDEQVAQTWKLPTSWKLNAQLVFGGKAAEAPSKEFAPLEDRVKVFGA